MKNARDFLHNNRKSVLVVALLSISIGVLWPETNIRSEIEIVPDGLQISLLNSAQASQLSEPEAAEAALPVYKEFSYTIAAGDTLGSIFNKLDLPSATMYRLLEADLDFVQLDSLSPGQTLHFNVDQASGVVQKMVLEIDPVRILEFIREGDDYEGQQHIRDTIEIERSVQGTINGSFYLSAQRAGLTAAEITTISRLFEDKINFARDLRAGDTFQVLFNDIYVGENPSGRSTLKAIIINNRKRQMAAFLHDDGQYYDEEGRSLNRAFLKSPLQKRFRISSQFNPTRLHPVTGRVAPHNGTDYATPTGTPAVAIGDGVVVQVGNHPIAGKYIKIQHSERYSTRYLHMSQIQVRRGQTVNIGDVIGRTGATGRVTGAHLHFELHASDRPVNFITYRLPEGRQLDKKQMVAFQGLIRVYLARMNLNSSSLIG